MVHDFGQTVLEDTIALVLFAFTSMIYNYYLGDNSLNFFSEETKNLFRGFRVLTRALIVWGSSQDIGTVFGFADVTMGLLALVNLEEHVPVAR